MLLKKLAVGIAAAAVFGVGTLTLANIDSSNLEKNNSATKQVNNKSGFYIRAEGSWGRPDSRTEAKIGRFYSSFNQPKKFIDISSFIISKSQGFSGRFALGYNFNTRLAVEIGANFIHSLQKSFLQQDMGDLYLSDIVFKTVVDLLGKVTFPFQNNFYAFAKGGVVYIQTKTLDKQFEDGEETGRNLIYYNDYFRPKVAVGIGYNLHKNLSADISLSQIFGTNSKIIEDGHLPHLYFITIAVDYKF